MVDFGRCRGHFVSNRPISYLEDVETADDGFVAVPESGKLVGIYICSQVFHDWLPRFLLITRGSDGHCLPRPTSHHSTPRFIKIVAV